jgi:hypothetical protein
MNTYFTLRLCILLPSLLQFQCLKCVKGDNHSKIIARGNYQKLWRVQSVRLELSKRNWLKIIFTSNNFCLISQVYIHKTAIDVLYLTWMAEPGRFIVQDISVWCQRFEQKPRQLSRTGTSFRSSSLDEPGL